MLQNLEIDKLEDIDIKVKIEQIFEKYSTLQIKQLLTEIQYH